MVLNLYTDRSRFLNRRHFLIVNFVLVAHLHTRCSSKTSVSDSYFIPKKQTIAGDRVPWTGSVTSGGRDFQEECCRAEEGGASGKAGRRSEVGLARGGVQVLHGIALIVD